MATRRTPLLARLATALVPVLLAAACADAAPDTADAPPPTAAETAEPAAAATRSAKVAPATSNPATSNPATSAPAAASTAPVTTAPAPQPFVSVGVEIGPTSTVVEAPVVATAAPLDPFGRYAACSGLRNSVASWSLQVSDPGHDITAVSILTGSEVTGPGTYDGTFRVEFSNGAALDGTGAVTLESGLQSGTFSAADADLAGTFACTGAAGPEPVDADVEVFALVRKGSAERVMYLAEPAPAEDCADGVSVAGDAGLGAPVELTIDPVAVAIRIGSVDVALDQAQTELHLDGPSGSFRAVTADGLTIDGAYTCS